MQQWRPGVYSLAHFERTAQEGATSVVLDHTGFPEEAGVRLDQGWHPNYSAPLRQLFS